MKSENLSLSELQSAIRDALYLSFPDFYWIKAEIAEIKENSAGHCYLELIEKSPDDKNIKARARGIIWNTRYRFLKAFFENATHETLRDGLKVLVKIKVEYHELYGLSLVISDIDPAFTLGEMAMKRQEIINRLMNEGIFDMNKELEFPLVPQRIAVISSKNAAGYTDFINELRKNKYAYYFKITLFDSILQGTETEQSIISALDKIALRSSHFDIVAIIRGGGSQADLSWFDSYNIAFHITQFPLPVITGIGHDKDVSVADMVSYFALKTPTAVAGYIIDAVAEIEEHIEDLGKRISEFSIAILEHQRHFLDSAAQILLPESSRLILQIREGLSSRVMKLGNNAREMIFRSALALKSTEVSMTTIPVAVIKNRRQQQETQIHDLQLYVNNIIKQTNELIHEKGTRITLLDPREILKRGYSITTLNGKIIKTIEGVSEGDEIETKFADGVAGSIVNRKGTK